MQDDIKTLQTNIKNINSIWKSVLSEAEPNFKTQVEQQVRDLNNRWEKVVVLASEQNKRLTEALEQSKSIYDRIEAINMFLKETKEGLANKDYSVENPNDLLVKTKRFKVFEEIYLHS